MKQNRCNFHLIILLSIIGLFIVVPVCAVGVPAGTPDPDFYVTNYQPEKVWLGTTLFADYHTRGKERIVEVNMQGEVVWEYVLPANLNTDTVALGLDVELLPNNNILFLLPRHGVYEINRQGTIVWAFLDNKVSHDADRLPNGNTLISWGRDDSKDDAQVKEVSPAGNVVWSWYAKDHFNKAPYDSIYNEGWTHANAVTRLPNGNTLINFRNFNLTVEVDPSGAVVWQYDWSSFGIKPHEPEILPNGNILVCFPPISVRAVEVNPKTNKIIWKYKIDKSQTHIGQTRDADRLPNGNTLINNGINLVELTPAGEIVWQLNIKGLEQTSSDESLRVALYKSERIGYMDPQFSITSPQQGMCSPKETDISIQYSDVDLNRIWYRIYDRTGNKWATDNITYVSNNWKNAITFAGKETGQNKVTLENGDYILHVWASSNGGGDENLYVPVKVITVEKTVDFKVTSDCVITKAISSTSVSTTSSAGITTAQSTSAPLHWAIVLSGIIIVGFVATVWKKQNP